MPCHNKMEGLGAVLHSGGKASAASEGRRVDSEGKARPASAADEGDVATLSSS